MDNLPNNNQNSDDSFSFSGQYPTKTPADSPGQAGTIGQTNAGAPPAFPEKTPAPAAQPTSPTDYFGAGAAKDEFTPPPPIENPADFKPPVDISQTNVGPEAPADNPFVVSGAPAKPAGGGGSILPRLLGFLVIILVLIGVGFAAFKFIGPLISKNQPLVLTYWGLWENPEVLDPVIAQYKKTHPNIEISYTKQSQKQYRERLQSAIERGEGPDIFRFHNTWVPMLKNDLAPSGKTGYGAAEFQQTFYPVASQDLVLNGKVYGAPLMFDSLGLYYNEDLLRNAGVTPPTTWEQLTSAVKSIRVPDSSGTGIVTAAVALGTTNNVEHYSDILALMFMQNGANLLNPVGKEAEDTLSFYYMFANPASEFYTWNETLDNSILAFANGKVAMIFAPSWQVFTIKQLNPNLKFQVLPVPQLTGTNTTWATYWVEGVSSKSKNVDAAWEFLKYLTSKESEVMLYTEVTKDKNRPFGEPYSRVDLAPSISNDPYVGAYIRQAQTAQSFFLASRTYDNGINDRMSKYLEDGINSLKQNNSVQSALEVISKGFAQVLSNYGFSSAGK